MLYLRNFLFHQITSICLVSHLFFSRRLYLYPRGKAKIIGTGHISLYLAIAETEKLPLGWEVNASFKFFLFDQIRDMYLTIQGFYSPNKHACLINIIIFHDFVCYISSFGYVQILMGQLEDSMTLRLNGALPKFFPLTLSMIRLKDTLSMIVVYLAQRFLFMSEVTNDSLFP